MSGVVNKNSTKTNEPLTKGKKIMNMKGTEKVQQSFSEAFLLFSEAITIDAGKSLLEVW